MRRLDQFLREGDFLAVGALGLEPAAAGEDLEILPLDDGEFRVQKRAVQPDQRLARRHAFAVMNQDLGHDPAIGMLHDLAALLDLDLAGGDDAPEMRAVSDQSPKPPIRTSIATSPRMTGPRADHSGR